MKKHIVIASLVLFALMSCGHKTYKQACAEKDFVIAHQELDRLRQKFIKNLDHTLSKKSNDALLKWFLGTSNASNVEDSHAPVTVKGYSEYSEADLYIFREELSFLMEQDGTDARVISLILETPIVGALNEDYKSYKHSIAEAVAARIYAQCTDRLNQKCDMALNFCILLNKQNLAHSILSLYKDDISVEYNGYNIYVDLSSTSRTRAVENYETAFWPI